MNVLYYRKVVGRCGQCNCILLMNLVKDDIDRGGALVRGLHKIIGRDGLIVPLKTTMTWD